MANDSRLDKDKELSWDEANEYAREMNEKKLGGHSDWRLPTIHEASSLFDEEKLNKDFKGGDIKIDSVFPPGAGNCTWTSDERGTEAQIAFYLNGCPYWYDKNDKTISHAVRLVRR
jgi:formylglycine-generating enzyme required for sulfatase activity